MKFYFAKAIVTAIWIAIGINSVFPFPGWLEPALSWMGILIAAAHSVEYIIFHKVILQRPESAVMAFFMTFLYGFLYWKDVSYNTEKKPMEKS